MNRLVGVNYFYVFSNSFILVPSVFYDKICYPKFYNDKIAIFINFRRFHFTTERIGVILYFMTENKTTSIFHVYK